MPNIVISHTYSADVILTSLDTTQNEALFDKTLSPYTTPAPAFQHVCKFDASSLAVRSSVIK